jgi:TonB family protein
MFEDLAQRHGMRRRSGWPLAASVLLHLAAVGALALGAARSPGPGEGERPIDVLFLRGALEGGRPAPAAPVSPAERQAERERQAMLDRLVQPTIVPDGARPAGAADPAGATGGAPSGEPDLPVDAGGGVTRPELVESSRVDPIYPEAAQRAGLEGLVVLRATIDERGRVGDLEVLRGLGLGLDEAAVAAVRHWRFRPATRAGKPVKVIYILSVYFRL